MTTLCFVFGRTQNCALSFFLCGFRKKTGILRVFPWGQNAF